MLWLCVPHLQHRAPRLVLVEVRDDWISLDLLDGRRLRLPTDWSPALLAASPAARAGWQLLRGGEAVRWAELGELLVLRSPDRRRPDPRGERPDSRGEPAAEWR